MEVTINNGEKGSKIKTVLMVILSYVSVGLIYFIMSKTNYSEINEEFKKAVASVTSIDLLLISQLGTFISLKALKRCKEMGFGMALLSIIGFLANAAFLFVYVGVSIWLTFVLFF